MTKPYSADALVEFAAVLVQTPSVLGNEAEVATAVSTEMERLGYDEVAIDSTGNAVGVVQGALEGPTILFDAHMDTVDVEPRESWSRDPFSGAVQDGKLYGRGSSDMKGALAAMVYAAARLDRSRMAGRVVVSASVGEEIVEGLALKRVMDRHRPDYVVIGESSDLNLVRAGRGRAEFDHKPVMSGGSPKVSCSRSRSGAHWSPNSISPYFRWSPCSQHLAKMNSRKNRSSLGKDRRAPWSRAAAGPGCRVSR